MQTLLNNTDGTCQLFNERSGNKEYNYYIDNLKNDKVIQASAGCVLKIGFVCGDQKTPTVRVGYRCKSGESSFAFIFILTEAAFSISHFLVDFGDFRQARVRKSKGFNVGSILNSGNNWVGDESTLIVYYVGISVFAD